MKYYLPEVQGVHAEQGEEVEQPQIQPQVQQRELRPRVNLCLPARYQVNSVELYEPVNFKDA